MMGSPQQIDMDFNAPAEDGCEIWQWERRETEKRIVKEWGLPTLFDLGERNSNEE